MASSSKSLDIGPSAGSNAADSNSQTVVLHILSPSLETPGRITLDDLPLTTKISELKTRLSQALPNNPRPDMQRLIYRGKPLSDNEEQLDRIIEPADGRVHTMHLALPPGCPKPPQNPHSNPVESNGIRHRTTHTGTSTPPPQPQTPPSIASQIANLRHQLATTQQRMAARFAQDARAQEANAAGDVAISTSHDARVAPSINGLFQNNASGESVVEPRTISQGAVPRGNFFPNSHSHQAWNPAGTSTTDSTTSRPPAIQRTASYPPASPINANYRGIGLHSPGDNRQQRIASALQYILSMENQLRQGILPSIEEISRIRIELYRLLDEQYRQPLAPRDGMVEALLGRLSSITARADQTRIYRARSLIPFPQNMTFKPQPTTADSTQVSVYLLSSPSGYHAVLMPPTPAPFQTIISPTNSIFPSHSTGLRTNRVPIPTVPQAVQNPTDPLPGAAPHLLERAGILQRHRHELQRHQQVMQEQQQQQPQAQDRVFGAASLARNIRRLWLFVRLYFFCYLLSEDGTWFRIFLVTFAFLTAIISETELPQQFQRVVLSPIQRHLENLLPLEGPRPRWTQPVPRRGGNTDAQPVHPRQPNNHDNLQVADGAVEENIHPTGVQYGVRRVERAVALFLASLVPGVGERHIAARNALEAARNQLAARAEEENQRQQEVGDTPSEDTPPDPETQPVGYTAPREGDPVEA
ncbi:hypothetical protein FQN55_007753 [Onygenales sp. PD_40]|nr:hypothetical protein FQN55_007753 [Onygenales sp. PD_40]KAK2781616.1 hypothetical protein FQN53_000502 [Emmonsiellopsis sp. PD_33]KAK2783807.1 hypothetical protein FQN52_009454 [Onygenales sp. PD_12]KAK2793800.1 hypothetical protein FQN51_001018 [Onygenales sp. PD_10]